MKTERWLLLIVAPAILGLVLVAVLAPAMVGTPHALDTIAAVAVLLAAIAALLAWRAARQLAARVDQLNDAARSALDARDAGTRREHAAEARAQEAVELLQDAVATIGAQLEDAQLPLHILLSSPFGELNENQEEMLALARAATDEAEIRVRQLAKLVELERGSIVIVPQPITVTELLRPALSIAEARAAKAGVHLRVQTLPTAPRVLVDPVHMQQALSALLTEIVSATPAEGEVVIHTAETAEDGAGAVRIAVTHTTAPATWSLEYRLARRLIEAQQGEVREEAGATIVEVPPERPSVLRATPAAVGVGKSRSAE